MADLYLVRIQPNPPGRDVARYGAPSASQLNNEWAEFEVISPNRNMTGDKLIHNTYTSQGCSLTGTDALVTFGSITLRQGSRVRIHTGSGVEWWEGNLLHVFANRSWYVWNNACGDRAQLIYDGRVIDWAAYSRNPREGVLTRIPYTNQFA